MTVATRAELRSDLQSLAGLDVTTDEANRYLNEGNTELCVRAGWTRGNRSIGPTVANQAAYALPSTLYRPLKVKVNGLPFSPADEETVDRILTDELRLRSWGIWWLSFDASDVEELSIYPAPTAAEAGLPIIATSIVYPAVMAQDGDSPTPPTDFHIGVRDYAAALAYGFQEDNVELRDYHMGQFDRTVERLRQHRNSRTGKGPVQMRVVGVSA